jgi:hypothetical protein
MELRRVGRQALTDGQHTANTIMLKMLDQIHTISPLQ